MKALMMCSVLAVIGIFGCVESPMTESDPVSETEVEISSHDEEIAGEDPALWGGGGTCCIDYVCPTTGAEWTGCKSGSTGPGGAFRACAAACGTFCHPGEWDCNY